MMLKCTDPNIVYFRVTYDSFCGSKLDDESEWPSSPKIRMVRNEGTHRCCYDPSEVHKMVVEICLASFKDESSLNDTREGHQSEDVSARLFYLYKITSQLELYIIF